MDLDGNRVFRVSEQNLSAISCDSVLREFVRFGQSRPGDRILLDLSGVTFVDPYGMGMLCLVARHLSRECWDITCRLPRSDSARSYLGRMRVLETLSEFTSLEGGGAPDRVGAWNEALLEVTPIARRDDVETVLGRIGRRVAAILAEELNYRDREIAAFTNVVAELCHNVLDHSFDRGYVAAQRYLDQRRGKKFAIVGVGDLGIGIRESLGVRYDVSDWTDATAITNAVRKRFSRDPTRGLGLYAVHRICQEYGGGLHIRSGDARVYLRGRGAYPKETAPFPGTQVSITLYQADSGR